LDYFGDQLKVILDGGECENGLESTIIGFENNQPILYRHGSIAQDEIEKIVGKLTIITKNNESPNSPGMSSRHYAPKTSTYLTNNVLALLNSFKGKKIGVLMFTNQIQHQDVTHQEILSESGDLIEAGRNLYAAMHRLDHRNLDLILAERLPDQGIGIAINDKLERATKKK
jgi:L-threonylcarbamoyladenylate synthase